MAAKYFQESGWELREPDISEFWNFWGQISEVLLNEIRVKLYFVKCVIFVSEWSKYVYLHVRNPGSKPVRVRYVNLRAFMCGSVV